ncbi:MAG: flagellar assembly protein FliW [Chloroflexi bacterium]|nr:MAG: flagellar assembly protein FliW [Chloroflexota bacterium]
MQVRTSLLGVDEVLEISEQQIFSFEPGLGGFDSLRRYALIGETDSPIEWLQSVEDPDVSFALLEPFLFRPDYVFELPDRDAEALGMQEPGDALVRCILTLNDDAEKVTANLLAPLVFCRRTHLARQVILQDADLEMRTPIFEAVRAVIGDADDSNEMGGLAATA